MAVPSWCGHAGEPATLTSRRQVWTFLPRRRPQCARITAAYVPSAALRSAETALNLDCGGQRLTNTASDGEAYARRDRGSWIDEGNPVFGLGPTALV